MTASVWLHATVAEDRVCRLQITPDALTRELVLRSALPVRSPVLIDGDSLAHSEAWAPPALQFPA